MFASGVRFYTSVAFLMQQLVVVACVIRIYSWFLPMSWVLGLSILLSVVCVYICSGDYVELRVILYLLQCLVYHMLSKMKRSSGIYILRSIG